MTDVEMSQGHDMPPSAYGTVIATTHSAATDTCISLCPFLSSWMNDPSLSKERKARLIFSSGEANRGTGRRGSQAKEGGHKQVVV